MTNNLEIKKHNKNKKSWILDIDYGSFHYRYVSNDEDKVKKFYEMLEIIKLGIKEENGNIKNETN